MLFLFLFLFQYNNNNTIIIFIPQKKIQEHRLQLEEIETAHSQELLLKDEEFAAAKVEWQRKALDELRSLLQMQALEFDDERALDADAELCSTSEMMQVLGEQLKCMKAEMGAALEEKDRVINSLRVVMSKVVGRKNTTTTNDNDNDNIIMVSAAAAVERAVVVAGEKKKNEEEELKKKTKSGSGEEEEEDEGVAKAHHRALIKRKNAEIQRLKSGSRREAMMRSSKDRQIEDQQASIASLEQELLKLQSELSDANQAKQRLAEMGLQLSDANQAKQRLVNENNGLRLQLTDSSRTSSSSFFSADLGIHAECARRIRDVESGKWAKEKAELLKQMRRRELAMQVMMNGNYMNFMGRIFQIERAWAQDKCAFQQAASEWEKERKAKESEIEELKRQQMQGNTTSEFSLGCEG